MGWAGAARDPGFGVGAAVIKHQPGQLAHMGADVQRPVGNRFDVGAVAAEFLADAIAGGIHEADAQPVAVATG